MGGEGDSIGLVLYWYPVHSVVVCLGGEGDCIRLVLFRYSVSSGSMFGRGKELHWVKFIQVLCLHCFSKSRRGRGLHWVSFTLVLCLLCCSVFWRGRETNGLVL